MKHIGYVVLILVNLVYACTSICTKMASLRGAMLMPFMLWIGAAVGVMGLYAILWQQVIMRVPIATAYMFKGTSLIFVLLFSVLLFGEAITFFNVVGAAIIIGGIILYSKA